MKSTIPPKWSWVKLGDVIDKISTTGIKLKQKEYLQEGKYPVVDQGQELIGGFSNDTNLIIDCDLPVIVFGDHTKVKKFIDFMFIAGADGAKVIKPHKVWNPKLFYYFLHCIKFPDKGYARHFQFVEKAEIPLPPLPEQKKIVEKIEELFSGLDDGVTSLKKAKEQIRLYRQSVLAAAFRGRLNQDSTDSKITRIKEKKSGNAQSPVNSNPENQNPGNPQILTNPGSDNLPNGWKWVKLGEVINSIQYGTSDKASGDEKGIPVLRMGNIQNGKLNFSNLKYFEQNYEDTEKYLLNDGDLLFNRTNSAELVGKSALYKKHHPKSIFASYLIRVKVKKSIYSSEFLNYYINSSYGRAFIKSVVSQNVGQANVNGTKLKNMDVPLVPLNQQHQIVSEIEKRFSEADNLEKAIDESIEKADRLRQSILKKAFEGRLV